MKEKIWVILGFATSVAVLMLLLYFATSVAMEGKMGLFELIYTILILIVVGGFAIVMLNHWKDLKTGIPLNDELTKQIFRKASSTAYFASVWIGVGLMWYSRYMPDLLQLGELAAEKILRLMILIPATIFIVLAFYYSIKGDAE